MDGLPVGAHLIMGALSLAIIRLYRQQQAMHAYARGPAKISHTGRDWWECYSPSCRCMRQEITDVSLLADRSWLSSGEGGDQ